MSDLVERLRTLHATEGGNVPLDAAMYIERLEKALRWFVDEYDKVQPIRRAVVHAPECRCVLCAYDNARAALEDK